MKLKSAVTTYEISLEELKDHFAEQLKVDKKKITVEEKKRWSGTQIDEYQVFDGLKITVKE